MCERCAKELNVREFDLQSAVRKVVHGLKSVQVYKHHFIRTINLKLLTRVCHESGTHFWALSFVC
jgi:hypothetical protein